LNITTLRPLLNQSSCPRVPDAGIAFEGVPAAAGDEVVQRSGRTQRNAGEDADGEATPFSRLLDRLRLPNQA